MKNTINWFEIPVTDFNRAKAFYSTIFEVELTENEMEGVKMGMFPYENMYNSGTIIHGEGYVPSAAGVVVYFDCGEDLSDVLSRVESAGGQIVVPKTHISDEHGYFAYFIDSEGNKLGLHSQS